MEALLLPFGALAIAAVAYVVYFVRRLLTAPDAGRTMRRFTLALLAIGGAVLVVAVAAAFVGTGRLSDTAQVVAAFDLTLMLMTLAVEGLGVGFRQMDRDGVGFIRFFQLGASIVLVLALAPAFYGYITLATRLQ